MNFLNFSVKFKVLMLTSCNYVTRTFIINFLQTIGKNKC